MAIPGSGVCSPLMTKCTQIEPWNHLTSHVASECTGTEFSARHSVLLNKKTLTVWLCSYKEQKSEFVGLLKIKSHVIEWKER